MITLLLIQKIVSLFLIMFAGGALVRCRVLSAKESRTLSVIALYLLTPSVIITSYQVDYTPEVVAGLGLALLAAVILHVLLILLNRFVLVPLRFDPVEQATILYSNAGNLIIPLVSSMLGSEWVIYTSAFMAVQQVLFWTHAKLILCGEKKFQIRKILSNVNIISIMIGIFLFATGLRLPGPLNDAVNTLGSMVGPVAMLVTGMLIGGMSLKTLLSFRRLWLVTVLRLIGVPLMALVFLRFSGIASLAPNGTRILLITFLATMTPSASTITNMSQLYGKNADYASAINVATTLFCIVTMPLLVMLYQL